MHQQLLMAPQLSGKHWLIESWHSQLYQGFPGAWFAQGTNPIHLYRSPPYNYQGHCGASVSKQSTSVLSYQYAATLAVAHQEQNMSHKGTGHGKYDYNNRQLSSSTRSISHCCNTTANKLDLSIPSSTSTTYFMPVWLAHRETTKLKSTLKKHEIKIHCNEQFTKFSGHMVQMVVYDCHSTHSS